MIIRALLRHFLLTLRLNFRSKQAIAYGYLVPILFLLAFASVFRGESPPLLGQMGQLLTLTILGGACFGLPTSLVAERERGVWKRYQLLPIGPASLLLSTLLARIVIIVSAVALQMGLARIFCGTPLPLHLGQAGLSILVVTVSFLGLGLLIASLADDVPAVQALGQCLFLPMIMIGGVGVPLATLPRWAQQLAGFLPGRYAVEALQLPFASSRGIESAGFAFLALGVIGTAAGFAGAKLLRREIGGPLGLTGKLALALALAAWVAVGATARVTGHLRSSLLIPAGFHAITAAQIEAITYDDLPGDNELYTRLAPPFETELPAGRLQEIEHILRSWPPAQTADSGQRARHLLSVASIADINADLLEGEIARVVFNQLQATIPTDELRPILAWIILAPNEAGVITSAPEFGFKRDVQEAAVRERSQYYAKKLLGRLLGKIPEGAP